MKKRWIALYVENNVGVLAKIAGLFSGKGYNMESLTVGTTEDPTVSRITIGANCNDEVFEQIKKQLNRMVDIIKVIDLTDIPMVKKELLYIKVKECNKAVRSEILQIASVFEAKIVDYNTHGLIIESLNTEEKNNDIVELMKKFPKVQVVRGGNVAIETL
ncbi:acetolactate synthase small subunit [Anaerosporobacter faecicola]|uniref:acetolactate synthase small subunit n=1 Tax=Anaerosporobacter faecicola TaxID=2718714 RepID=UPI00143AED7D|nr:acetolactate synthase small subunit [Anaerosporobacter faecicola]